MMESSVSLFKVSKTIAVTVFSCVFLAQSAPTSDSLVALTAFTAPATKKTCIHRDSAEKPDWKKCVSVDPKGHQIPSYDDLSIARDISNNMFHAMQVPKNEMKCHTVERYNYTSLLLPNTGCPALCKLRDVVGKHTDCEDGLKDLITQHVFKQKRIVVLKSPHYFCDTKYHRKEICLYNISMACKAEHIKVSTNPELTHMAVNDSGDFVQIVDYIHSQVYKKVSGNKWPQRQTNIYSSDFVLVFWSEPHWKPPGSRGFKLHLECDVSTTDSSDGPWTDGSAEYYNSSETATFQ